MSNALIGKGPNSSVWHVVRRPHLSEGVTIEEARAGRVRQRDGEPWPEEDCIDRSTHRMSLCSLVWEITQVKIGEPTCKTCLKQLELIEHPCRHDSAAHRQHQKRTIVWCP